MEPQILANLRTILANLYADAPSIRRIIEDAGLSASIMPVGTNVINIWHAVLVEANNQNEFSQLLTVVDKEYGANPELRDALRKYRDSECPPADSNEQQASDKHLKALTQDCPLEVLRELHKRFRENHLGQALRHRDYIDAYRCLRRFLTAHNFPFTPLQGSAQQNPTKIADFYSYTYKRAKVSPLIDILLDQEELAADWLAYIHGSQGKQLRFLRA
ncbi:MAG: effector-associated domain EAD1-containing protein [Chloroflexota bacterium]